MLQQMDVVVFYGTSNVREGDTFIVKYSDTDGQLLFELQ